MAPPKTNAEALAMFRRYSMGNYEPAPVAFARGQGARLWDVEGKDYLDFAAGVAVTSLGHSHATWAAAVSRQANTLAHTSNLYLVPNQLLLARELVGLSGLDRAFFCNSGTEAMEAALKLARYWGRNHGGRHGIISTTHSFHGRTMGALTLTGQTHYQEGFSPLLPGVDHVPFGDLGAMERAIKADTCAIVLEPIQGEGGVRPAPRDYLRGVRKLCDERDLLLVLDEVQTGIGRTGTWFAFEHSGIRPDVVALAKGLGGGFPIGALLCNERANAFQPGSHGSTFGGNPLACAAALSTLSILRDENGLANVRAQGAAVAARLQELEGEGRVVEARGMGLLQAFDLPDKKGAKVLNRRLLEAGLLVTALGDAGIRLAPPLLITKAETDEGLAKLSATTAAIEAR